MSEAKKYVREYQPRDKEGHPIGPKQVFRADTKDELIDLLAAAHANSSANLYETKRAVKLGALIEPDPDEPIPTFEGTELTADQRLKIAKELQNPETVANALDAWATARFGVPLDAVRATLRNSEINVRVGAARQEVDTFMARHPEYKPTEKNKEILLKWLGKGKPPLALTAKNLELALEDLKADQLIELVEEPPIQEPPPTTKKPTEGEPEPPAANPIGNTDTVNNPPTPNSETRTARPSTSSSGLSSRDSTATPVGGTPPKTKEITLMDVNRMNSDQYTKALQDPVLGPKIRKLVDEKS
jgi:hypothetical protein